jgi:hypothetical protein
LRDHVPITDSSGRGPAGGETVLLEWTVHLLRREPARARVVGVAMALSSALGVWMFRSPLFALLGPVLLLSATAEYLLPIRYRLTDRRACASYGAARLEIAWDRLKRRDVGSESIKLSPFAAPNRLDNFRGVVLRFGNEGGPGSRESVMRIVEERMAACRAAPGPAVSAGAEGAAS